MRQRTLGLIGVVLVIAGIALSASSDIAARRFAPTPTLATDGGQVQLPLRHRNRGPVPNFPGHQPDTRLGPGEPNP